MAVEMQSQPSFCLIPDLKQLIYISGIFKESEIFCLNLPQSLSDKAINALISMHFKEQFNKASEGWRQIHSPPERYEESAFLISTSSNEG